MAIDWVNTAVAVASRLQFDQACGRSRLLSEDYSRVVLAESIQPYVSGVLDPEFNHPDLPGNSRIDLLVRTPRAGNIETVIEHKWVRATTSAAARNWMAEILTDLVRVEAVDANLVQGAERVLVVAGEVDEMRVKVWERMANAGAGQPRTRVVEQLLQSRPASGDTQASARRVYLGMRGAPFAALLRAGAGTLYNALPQSYEIQLVGHHRTRAGGIECAIWRVARPLGRRVTFDGATTWP